MAVDFPHSRRVSGAQGEGDAGLVQLNRGSNPPRKESPEDQLAEATRSVHVGTPDSGAAHGNLVRLPTWLRRAPGGGAETVSVKKLLRKASLNTVCEEARCPNISECFSRGTATFMILGDICTRGCRFCSVKTGRPQMAPSNFVQEADRLAAAVIELNLRHVVITSVARDDLKDGGASGFAASIAAVRERAPSVTVEVLIPDLRGSAEALDIILSAAPDVLNHNLETVPRLYRRVRPGSSYRRSLELLERSRQRSNAAVKTGIMVGLGETEDEVIDLMRDARAAGVDIFTTGQYMRPTKDHLPVVEYVPPERFDRLAEKAREIGFPEVFIGPLIRSSYHADEAKLLSAVSR